jgi:hypothetical protein
MSEVAIVETRKQHVAIGVTQSFDVGITTIGMEIVVVPNLEVVIRGILIGFATNLGSGSDGVSTRRNLNRSLTLLTTTTRVVGTPRMVFTDLIMIIHVNRTAS